VTVKLNDPDIRESIPTVKFATVKLEVKVFIALLVANVNVPPQEPPELEAKVVVPVQIKALAPETLIAVVPNVIVPPVVVVTGLDMVIVLA